MIYKYVEQHQTKCVCPDCGLLATRTTAEFMVEGIGMVLLNEESRCPNGHVVSEDDPRWDEILGKGEML